MTFPAFLDTCTLFGAAVNDLFLELADRGAFRPLWSADVFRELERNLKGVGVSREQVERRVSAMQSAFPDAEVTGYEDLVDQMTCDPKDRHVLAAAVRANAEVIVTFNLKDFPPESFAHYEVEVVHPDEFLLDQLDLYESLTMQAILEIASAYESPPMTPGEFLDIIDRAGAPKFAAEAATHL